MSIGRTVTALVTVAVGALLLTLGVIGAVHGTGASAGVPENFGALNPSSAVAAVSASPSALPSRQSSSSRPHTAARTTTAHGTSSDRSPVKPTDDGVPVGLRLPDLGVRAAVTPVVSRNGVLDVPEDPQVLGWWAGGARPGQFRGTVVIDGHVDSAVSGPGALYRLENLRSGDAVQVSTATGRTVDYRVIARRSYPKTDGLPASIFTSTGPAKLALVTCGGPFDRQARSYEDNVVVIAEPTGS